MMKYSNNIIEGLHKGDGKVMDTIYDEYYCRLLRVPRSNGLNRQDAEEIVSDAMMALWRMRMQFTNTASVEAFLFTVAKNKCIDHMRRCKTGKVLSTLSADNIEAIVVGDENSFSSPFKTAESAWVLEQLYKAIEQLSPRQRDVIKLTIKGFSNQEIASALTISESTVRSHRETGIKVLQEKLQHIPPPDEVGDITRYGTWLWAVLCFILLKK